MNYPDVVALSIPLFVLSILVEMGVWRLGGRLRYEARDSGTSLLMGLGYVTQSLVTGALILKLNEAVYAHRLFDLPEAPWVMGLCFFAEDHSYYWFHRVSHERRWFWASHVVHHSSQHYNLSTALRQAWTTALTGGWIFWLPLPLLGFPPKMVAFFSGVSLVYQFWIHTEGIRTLGPFEAVFNTPAHHRVHHGTTPADLDRNYAGILIVWDRLYRTFQPELAGPHRYGIVHQLRTFNPVRVALHEWAAIGRELMAARSVRQVLGTLFGPPGWASGETTAVLKQRG